MWASSGATLIPMKATSGFWKEVCEAVTKSPIRVPIPITRSASRISRLAARPPFVPAGPMFIGWVQGRAPLPAWVSTTGMPKRLAKPASSSVASA